MNFISELKRRNVIRMAGLYVVGAWLITQVAGTILPMFGAPDWIARSIVILLAICFIPALAISWIFELTPEGLKRDSEVPEAQSIAPQTARKMERSILLLFAIALAFFGFDKFYLAPKREIALVASTAQAVKAEAIANTQAASASINSIAVLPFQNKNSDADTEYLSDGLAESLIYRLAQLPNLKVSPSSSIFRYKGKTIDPVKVGAELGVSAVMTGRLVQRGDDLTISVELLDIRNNNLLWGEQYNRKMSELLATQREISIEIVEKLQLKLSGSEVSRLEKKYTNSNEAYQAYLKGRFYWNRRTAENLKKAIEQFQKAVALDPNYALAYAGLADSYFVLPQYAGTPVAETVPKVRAYAERAIAIDGQLGEPHASLASAYNQMWQWTDAEQSYKRAIALSPKYATAYHWYSIFLRELGRFDEAAAMIKRAQELDPLSSVIGVNVSIMYQLQNDHQASIENSLKIIELNPTFSSSYNFLGQSYLKLGRNAEAISSLEKAVELSNRASFTLITLGYGYAVTGNRAGANAIIKELQEKYARKEASGLYVAGVYAGLGDNDKAFEWLEKDFKAKQEMGDLRWSTPYESLRDDPRYKNLLKRMGLPVEEATP